MTKSGRQTQKAFRRLSGTAGVPPATRRSVSRFALIAGGTPAVPDKRLSGCSVFGGSAHTKPKSLGATNRTMIKAAIRAYLVDEKRRENVRIPAIMRRRRERWFYIALP